ncbi:MAG: hypothetical protein COV70_02550 [Parcubacteria group bacterium CG11_big_fil_rev_8_21_14_0_20_39_22]|nr:MAG: hypothetical protein COV70_02550 [Parcubacteria group bacterium CG11_big_fil_rev_8_21_14_0_20_39_22]
MKYLKINPGGNITAIVRDNFTQKEKVKLSQKIMRKDKTIEQVGFWSHSKNKKNDGFLDMAGGELCGNAMRALGMLIYKETGKSILKLESSGTNEVVKTYIKGSDSAIKLSLDDFSGSKNYCSLPGIKYFITKKVFERVKAYNILKRKFGKFPASGIISYKKEKSLYVIKPIIWVRAVDSLIEETACGSGTLALAFLIYSKYKTRNFKIKQPSGSIFDVVVGKRYINLSGPILKIENIILL